MRLVVDLQSHVTTVPQAPKIVQVEGTPAVGDKVPIGGRYVIPVVKGVEFPVDANSYVLDAAGDLDGGDVSSISYSYLLAMYAGAGYGNVYFNPLLTAQHVDELDFATTFRDTFSDPPNILLHSPRFQTGRGAALPQPGQMPMMTALLPMNTAFDPLNPTAVTLNGNRPGMLMSKEIDIGPYTLDSHGNPVGTDQFLLYWKLYDFDMTQDISNQVINDPALRSVMESDQEPDGFTAYISPDNGTTWCRAGLLEPVAFCDKVLKIRVAFLNTSASKRYVATFAVLW